MLQTEKENLLQNLACFGCEYKNDCESKFGHGHSQCDEKYEEALIFASRNKLITEKEISEVIQKFQGR